MWNAVRNAKRNTAWNSYITQLVECGTPTIGTTNMSDMPIMAAGQCAMMARHDGPPCWPWQKIAQSPRKMTSESSNCVLSGMYLCFESLVRICVCIETTGLN